MSMKGPVVKKSSVRLREAELFDADAIAAIHAEGWRTNYAGFLPASAIEARDEHWRRQSWRRKLGREKKGCYAFVVEAAMYGGEKRVLLREYLEQGWTKTALAESCASAYGRSATGSKPGNWSATWTSRRSATGNGLKWSARSMPTARSSRRGCKPFRC